MDKRLSRLAPELAFGKRFFAEPASILPADSIVIGSSISVKCIFITMLSLLVDVRPLECTDCNWCWFVIHVNLAAMTTINYYLKILLVVLCIVNWLGFAPPLSVSMFFVDSYGKTSRHIFCG
jgi:hypothetical protein